MIYKFLLVLKSTSLYTILLVLFTSLSLSNNVKIQLDEKFEFIGIDNYDNSFNKKLISNKSILLNIDNEITNSTDPSIKRELLQKRSEIEKNTLDFKIKNHIQSLLLKYYDNSLIENRLGNMDSNTKRNQKYVYIKGNVSKVNKVEFTIGGNLDLSTKKTKDKKGSNTKQVGIKETILTVTCGIEIYNLSTGELYHTNVYTFGSKVRRDLDKPLTDKEIIEMYESDIMNLFDELIKETSKNYNPSIAEATIVKKIKENYVIDKGTNDGFIVGKTVMGKDVNFDIIESTPDLSVIKPFFKDKKNYTSEIVQLFGNKSENTNKPKVLVTEVEFLKSYMFDDDLDYDKSTITQWFKDYLSTNCDLFIVPSDPRTINNFQEEVSMYGKTSSKTLLKKLIKPDYIIYPKIIYAYNVNNQGQTSQGIETSISTLDVLLELQLIDFNTGIIIKTKRYNSTRDQEQSDIANVNMGDLFPAVIKDGIISLTEELGDELSVNKIEAEIQKGKKNIYNINFLTGSTLSNGEILKVFRKGMEIKDLNGNSIGYLEKYIGDIKVNNNNGKITVSPYMPWTEVKYKDIIRGYTSSSQLSDNIISIKMTFNEIEEKLTADVTSRTKTDLQVPLPKNLVLSNYYYIISNHNNFTPILDSQNQEFLNALKSLMNKGYYARTEKKDSNVSVKYYADIRSTIFNKNKVHDNRIDLQYTGRIRLFDKETSQDFVYKSFQGVERTIGDTKTSSSKDRKRAKRNIIMKGLSEKEINKEFFDINLKAFDTCANDISSKLN